MAERICGIYCIENLVNGKKYIGQSKNINDRWKLHKSLLDRKKHPNSYLSFSWEKYKKENFYFEVLETCEAEELNEKEAYWINKYNTFDRLYGYNLKYVDNNKTVVSEETKIKLSKSHSGENHFMFGKKHSASTLKIMSDVKLGAKNPRYGVEVSDETRKKMSKSNKTPSGENSPMWGTSRSQEIKEKISKNIPRLSGENHPMYGRKQSDETIKKKVIKITGRVSKKSSSKSNYFGVCVKTYSKKNGEKIVSYGSRISIDGKDKYLGTFKIEIDAAKEFDKASWERYHNFDKLNFPKDYE